MRTARARAATITRILEDTIINSRIFCFRGIMRGPIDIRTFGSKIPDFQNLLILHITKPSSRASVTILHAAETMTPGIFEAHFADGCSVTSHQLLTGVHWKITATPRATVNDATKPIKTYIQILLSRSVNTLILNMQIPILVVPSVAWYRSRAANASLRLCVMSASPRVSMCLPAP